MWHWRNLWRQEWGRLRSDRAILLTLVGGILFYAWLYPLPYSQQVVRDLPVVLVDEDGSALARQLAFMVDATPQVALVGQAATLGAAQQWVADGRARGILLIPRHFYRDLRLGRSVTVSVAADGAYYLMYGTIAEGVTYVAQTLGAGVQISRLLAAGHSVPAAQAGWRPFAVSAQPVFNPALGYQQYVVPGVFLFILHQTLLIVAGLHGVSRRLAWHKVPLPPADLAPCRRQGLLTGLYLALYLLPTLFYLGPIQAWYGMARLADPWALLLFLLPFFVAVSQLGILLGAWLPRREQVTPLVMLSSLPLLFLSGLIWPRSMLPLPLAWLAALLPSTWGIEGLLQLNAQGAGWASVLPLWGRLWALAAGLAVLAGWRLRRQARLAPQA